MDMMMVEHSEHSWADLMDGTMDMSRDELWVCLLADLKDVHLVHHLVDPMEQKKDDLSVQMVLTLVD